MSSADIAKVARGHGKAHTFGAGACGLKVTRKVIHHLSDQARPIDGVDGTNFVSAFELQVVRNGFYDVLTIVKHTFNSQVVDVGILQTEHLRLLKRAHPPMRAGHEHPHALLATHGVFGRTTRVAAGGAQNVELLATPSQLVFKQMAQQLHGHVFKSQSRSVGQA